MLTNGLIVRPHKYSMSASYKVLIYDNTYYGDESERFDYGVFFGVPRFRGYFHPSHRKHHPEGLPFALALVAKQLKTFWQLIRLATKAAPSKNAVDIAATPYAIAVAMVLDQLEDKGKTLRAALKDNKVVVARDLLADLYDAEFALRVRIDYLDRSDWGLRLHRTGSRHWLTQR
jgi:hypothetical protein